ncbi:MAG: DsbC family protein [Gammaproteobacteria bacterium]
MNSKIFVRSLFVLLFISASACADSTLDKAAIKKVLGGSVPTSIEASRIPGLYEVVVDAHVLYMSGDGRYVVQGEMIDTKEKENLTEPALRQARQDAVAKMGADKMIVFTPKEKKHSMTVFTDIDCGYCRKLHSELDQYLAKGIEVRYMMYPRAGKDSDAYKKAVAVWCSDDRQDALTKSKKGTSIPMKTCANPIDTHMKLAHNLGLQGTPLVVLDDGSIQPGYVPPAEVEKYYKQIGAVTK